MDESSSLRVYPLANLPGNPEAIIKRKVVPGCRMFGKGRSPVPGELARTRVIDQFVVLAGQDEQ